MANRIKQFRYYNEDRSQYNNLTQNQPSQFNGRPVSYHDYITGDVFDNYLPILKLGIQSIPGTKFYLNYALDPIYIGNTGIFELELKESQVSSLQFDAGSMRNINNNDSAYLIVDIIYDDSKT